ncbi:MAG TPA: endonuclease V [Kofleriaceae bacterium]
MLAVVDVHYATDHARAACVGFAQWTDATAVHTSTRKSDGAPADYAPGSFYLRELPHLLAILEPLRETLELVIVDGFAMLDATRPGLGGHLSSSMGLPVIGVAKTRFVSAPAVPIVRGNARPLYVTAVGIDANEAARHITEMHGPYRLPTLLKLADSLARGR